MSPAPRGAAPQRILIIKPSSLGDIVHALPVLAGLRDAYPDAHLAWLVTTAFAPLLHGHPLLDEIITFDRRQYGRMLQSWRSLVDFLRFLRDLRGRRFDLVLDLQGLFRSGFLARATGAATRVGFRDARELAAMFYTRRVRVPPSCGPQRNDHAVDRNLHLARELGLPVDPPLFPLGVRPEELDAARRLLARIAGASVESFTAVLPGARWNTKRWRVDRFAELCDRLHAQGLPRCVLLGSPEERTYSDALVSAARAPVIDLVGRTSLRECTALLTLASLVICNDSGPMHIAAALRRPVVAIFGPTNAARTGPYGETAHVVSLPLPCSPCYRRRCPLGHHDCMQKLETAIVWKAVATVLAKSSSPCR